MGRISRKCYESEFFRVMVQGIKKERIFSENIFKEKYILFLNQAIQKYDVKIIAYCIMDNHVHLIVYTKEIGNLTKIMASANTKYALFYNKIKSRCGYVYRDRYRCENLYTQNYLENCIRYVHNNPVKANICNVPSQYKYSSFNKYINNQIENDIVNLVFGDDSNYMEKLTCSVKEDKFIDVENEYWQKNYENIEKILKEYEEIDLKNEYEIVKLAHELQSRCSITKKEVAKILKIDRTKLYRMMKKVRI